MTAALLDISQARAEELVDTLVDMQLLDVAGPDASGQLRYRFHGLLRAYAREVAAAEEPEADRLAALDRAFGGWLALAEEAGRCTASSAFTDTFEAGTCWRPDEAVVGSVVADPSGWFQAEWPALVGAVEQAYSVESDQLGWALGVRLAKFFLADEYYNNWRHVCEVMLAGARRVVSGGREGMAVRGLGEFPLLQHRLDEALAGCEQTGVTSRSSGVHESDGVDEALLAALQGTQHPGW